MGFNQDESLTEVSYSMIMVLARLYRCSQPCLHLCAAALPR